MKSKNPTYTTLSQKHKNPKLTKIILIYVITNRSVLDCMSSMFDVTFVGTLRQRSMTSHLKEDLTLFDLAELLT